MTSPERLSGDVADVRSLMSGAQHNREPFYFSGRTGYQPIVDGHNVHSGVPVAERPSAKSPIFRLRQYEEPDLEGLVMADLRAFRAVYRSQFTTREEMYEAVGATFKERYQRLDPRWTDVLTDEAGKIMGFLTMFPTNKPPQDFISWEETTDNGTLSESYDESGAYLYVASLTTVGEASSRNAQNMMLVSAMSKVIQSKKDAYFVLRMPGLQKYVINWSRENEVCLESLSPATLLDLAVEYSEKTITQGDKEVVVDPVLRNAEKIGCKIIKVVPDAYQDPQSMNFGAVASFESAVPKPLKLCGALGRVAYSGLLNSCSRSLKVSNWICGDSDDAQDSQNAITVKEEGLKKSKFKDKELLAALGLVVASPVIVHLSGQTGETVDALWSGESLRTLVAVGALEAGWIGGAALSLYSFSKTVDTFNPLKVRAAFAELKKTNSEFEIGNQKLFNFGFYTNFSCALAQNAVIAGYTIKTLPPSSWLAPMVFVGADLAATLWSRRVIYNRFINPRKS